MNNQYIIRSFIEGGMGWVLLGAALSALHGIPFMQALLAPSTLLVGVAGVVGSYIGYRSCARKHSHA